MRTPWRHPFVSIRKWLRIFSFTVMLGASGVRAAETSCLVYVGTYTDRTLLMPTRANAPGERSKGIYAFRFDLERGTLTPLGLAAESANPTYVTFSPSGKFLYATNEIYQFDGAASGAVSAFAIDPATGRLTLLNQISARGTGTCHASVDRTGRALLAANFGSGSVVVLPIQPDGRLRAASAFAQDAGAGPNSRQATPHAHSFNLSPDNRLAVAAEFSTDRLLLYRFDAAAGSLAPAEPPQVTLKPGSAPRHFAFHPDGKSAYSLNEIDSTLTVLAYDAARGTFTERQNLSALPANFTAQNTAAEVVVHPSGKFVYTSNRGHHSIAVFAVGADGTLKLVTHVLSGGRTPRGFSVDPTGRWLIAANQDTHTINVFSIDAATGVPKATEVSAPVHTPVCVKFLPPGS